MKILLVEDELSLANTVKRFLESEKYIVETGYNYAQALEKINLYEYDCILLDIMLPDGNGIDLLKEIKKLNKKDAIIILSAKDSVEDKIMGLDYGADDYLAKPFNLMELHARIKSAVRRKNHEGEKIVSYKNVKLYPEERKIMINDTELFLTRKEFDLFYYFMINPNKVLQKASLAESVWGDHIDQADSLDFIYSQVKNIRKKLKDTNAEVDFQAVYGIGYKLV